MRASDVGQVGGGQRRQLGAQAGEVVGLSGQVGKGSSTLALEVEGAGVVVVELGRTRQRDGGQLGSGHRRMEAHQPDLEVAAQADDRQLLAVEPGPAGQDVLELGEQRAVLEVRRGGGQVGQAGAQGRQFGLVVGQAARGQQQLLARPLPASGEGAQAVELVRLDGPSGMFFGTCARRHGGEDSLQRLGLAGQALALARDDEPLLGGGLDATDQPLDGAGLGEQGRIGGGLVGAREQARELGIEGAQLGVGGDEVAVTQAGPLGGRLVELGAQRRIGEGTHEAEVLVKVLEDARARCAAGPRARVDARARPRRARPRRARWRGRW